MNETIDKEIELLEKLSAHLEMNHTKGKKTKPIKEQQLSDRPCEILSQREIDALLSTVEIEKDFADRWESLNRDWQAIQSSGLDIMHIINNKLNLLFRAIKEK